MEQLNLALLFPLHHLALLHVTGIAGAHGLPATGVPIRSAAWATKMHHLASALGAMTLTTHRAVPGGRPRGAVRGGAERGAGGGRAGAAGRAAGVHRRAAGAPRGGAGRLRGALPARSGFRVLGLNMQLAYAAAPQGRRAEALAAYQAHAWLV